MPLKREADGKRSVQVETEVQCTPEQAWRAIATATGISSWFVPTTSEDDDNGVPRKITMNFGPGMDSVSTVTEWNPPHLLCADSHDLGPDAPAIATQWIVETRDGGTCVVRVVHSLFSSTDDWDSQMEGWESGWPGFFRILRLYLGHFADQPSAAFQLMGFHAGPSDVAWQVVLDMLGRECIETGDTVQSVGDAPRFGGIVETVGGSNHAEDLLVRLDAPAPGIAHLFAMKMGEQVVLSIRLYLYGEDAAETARREEPLWQAWLAKVFPQAG